MAKVRTIHLDDDGEPYEVVVALTKTEAALVARLTGALSPNQVVEALGHRTVDASSSIFDALTGDCFNRYWEGGLNEVMRRVELEIRPA